MQSIQGLIENVEKVIVGKRPVIELAVVALLCRGQPKCLRTSSTI